MTAPPADTRKALTGAILWLLFTAIVTAFVFIRADEKEENRTFYLLAGVVAAIATVMNAINAWKAYRQHKASPGS